MNFSFFSKCEIQTEIGNRQERDGESFRLSSIRVEALVPRPFINYSGEATVPAQSFCQQLLRGLPAYKARRPFQSTLSEGGAYVYHSGSKKKKLSGGLFFNPCRGRRGAHLEPRGVGADTDALHGRLRGRKCEGLV